MDPQEYELLFNYLKTFTYPAGRGVGSVKLGREQLEFRGGTEKKLNLSSIKPHVIYVYF